MASKTKDILIALKTQVETITKANGYNKDVKKVTYRFLDTTELTYDNTICIIPGDSPITALTNDCFTVGSPTGLDGWAIGLFLFSRTKTDTDKSGSQVLELEELIGDVIKCIMANTDLDTSGVRISLPRTVERYPNIDEAVSMAIIPLEVKYDFLKTAT